MLTVSIEGHFSAAHRIEGHPRCSRLHGHNYVVKFEFTGPIQDDGMVADFSDLKELVKGPIDAMDHRYIVSQDNLFHDDPYAVLAQEQDHAVVLAIDTSTAECLVDWFFYAVQSRIAIDSRVKLVSVTVFETPTSYAKVIHD